MSQKLTDKVRQALQELGRQATKRDVAEFLEVRSRAEREQVHEAVKGMVRTGEVKMLDRKAGKPRLYLWQGNLAAPGGEKQAKLWHAMQIKSESGPFSARDVAVIAGTSLDYAKRYIAWLWRKEWLMKNLSQGTYRVFRPRQQDEAPRWTRRAAAPPCPLTAAAPAPLSPGAACAGQIKRLLAEMRQVVAGIAGEVEMMTGILDEMGRIFPGCGKDREVSDAQRGKGPDQS